MKGLTLIELSVALGILAILAAVMLPRIAQLQRMARVGKLQSFQGEVAVRSMLVRTAALLRDGTPDTTPCRGGRIADNRREGPGSLCTELGLVDTVHGQPAANPASPVFALPAEAHESSPWRVRQEAGRLNFSRADASDPARCGFTFSQAVDARTAAATSTPVVSGC